MKRHHNVPFAHSVAPERVAPAYKLVPTRVPAEFIQAMKLKADYSNIRTPDPTVKTQAKTKKAQSSANKWRSSFKPLGDEDDDDGGDDDDGDDDDVAAAANDQSTSSSEKVALYDPYDAGSPESETELAQKKDYNRSSSEQNQDHKLERQRLSPGISCRDKSRWDSTISKPGSSRVFVSHDFSPEPRPTESHGLGSGHRLPEQQAYSPHDETIDRPMFGCSSRDVDHRIYSPDMIIHNASTQECLASYGQKADGEERIRVREHRREMTTVRLSPPKAQHDCKRHLGRIEKDQDPVTPAAEVTRNRIKTIMMDESPVTCDLCDVELAHGQELEDHLESKNHWVILEYIQQKNNYDDLAIAFLQDVMMYKSRHFSRAIEESALLALHENDHMTKVEMFHCAACNVFVSTSALLVQAHITSQEHLAKTGEFQVQQRRNCLDKAGTIMKELKPQFELFIKGDKPFE